MSLPDALPSASTLEMTIVASGFHLQTLGDWNHIMYYSTAV